MSCLREDASISQKLSARKGREKKKETGKMTHAHPLCPPATWRAAAGQRDEQGNSATRAAPLLPPSLSLVRRTDRKPHKDGWVDGSDGDAAAQQTRSGPSGCAARPRRRARAAMCAVQLVPPREKKKQKKIFFGGVQ